MADKIPVVIEKVVVRKTFDAKATKAVPDLVAAALGKAIGKSGKLEIKNRVAGKDKGFAVNFVAQDISYDEKKGAMSAKAQAELSTLPGPKMFASLTGSSKIDGVNPKKLENDVKDLLSALADDLGGKARKGLEGKIGSF